MAWSSSAKTIVVAHDGRIDGFDRSGERKLWSVAGLANPSGIAVSDDGDSIAILDGYEDRVAIVAAARGTVQSYETPNTPVAAAFFGRDLWVVLRDQSRVRRIAANGEVADVEVVLDPALIAVSDLFVYVYSRSEGVLQEIDPRAAKITRVLPIGINGTDLEVQLPKPGEPLGAKAYICRGPAKKVTVVDLKLMKASDINLGAVPMDIAFVPWGAQLSLEPGTPFVADPARQALYASAHLGPSIPIRPPTPVDRVTIAGSGIFVFDSGGGTLYRVEGRNCTRIASDLTPLAFVATPDALFTWDAKTRKPVSHVTR